MRVGSFFFKRKSCLCLNDLHREAAVVLQERRLVAPLPYIYIYIYIYIYMYRERERERKKDR